MDIMDLTYMKIYISFNDMNFTAKFKECLKDYFKIEVILTKFTFHCLVLVYRCGYRIDRVDRIPFPIK